MIRASALAAAVLLCCGPLLAQDESAGSPSVHYSGPAQIDIKANRREPVEFRFTIAPNFHINSHAPRDKELIPTRLIAIESTGIDISDVHFPEGEDYAFPFDPENKLSVYTGEFAIKAQTRTAPGEHTLQVLLHYQACDNRMCYPPRDLPFEIKLIAK